MQRFSRRRVQRTFRQVRAIAQGHGWELSITGSCAARGYGHDLDLHAIPVYVNARARGIVVADIVRTLDWVVVSSYRDALHGYYQVLFSDTVPADLGHIVDIVFWRRGDDPGPRLRDVELDDAIYEAGGMGV